MNKLIRKSLKGLIKNQCRNDEEYKSLVGKAIDYLQTGERKNQIAPKFRSKDFLDDEVLPIDRKKIDPRNRITLSVEEDIIVFEDQQKQIGDMERIRMKNIDKVLQTDTYFHETKPYEERIDTEHIMERSIVKQSQKSGRNLMQRFLEFDPQEKRQMPKFRSFKQFSKNLQQIKNYPKHEKDKKLIKTAHFQITDEYRYLKLEQKFLQKIKENITEDSSLREKGLEAEQQEQLKKIQQFIMSENLYTDMSLIQGSQLEDILLKEYEEKVGNIQMFPLYYEDFIYYMKNNQFESNLNLYRVSSKQYKNKEFDLDQYQMQKIKNQELQEKNEPILDHIPEEELVISKEEISQFLEKYENDMRISYLLDQLDQNALGYHDLIFDKQHEKMAIFFDVYGNEREFVLLIKDLKNNTFFPTLITDLQDQILFDDFNNFYFIRSSAELERPYQLFRSDFKNSEKPPGLIYEEKDPNFKISIKSSLSNKFGLLYIESISGEKVNEIFYKELFKEESPFKQLLSRNLGQFHEVKVGADSFFYTSLNQNQNQNQNQSQNNQENQQDLDEIQKNKLQQQQLYDNFYSYYPDKIMRLYFEPESRELLEQKENEKKNALMANFDEIKRTIEQGAKNSEFLKKVNQEIIVKGEKEIILKEGKNKLEVFYQCEKGEYIEDFEILENYAGILLQPQNQLQYLKFYNFRNEQFHSLQFDEPLYQITQEKLQNYNSQYYQFQITQPHTNTQIYNYNIPLRELSNLHTTKLSDFNSDNYIQEQIYFETRDEKELPTVLVYQKENINSESPIIIRVNQQMNTLKSKYELTPWDVLLLDRGFVLCYPLLRGQMELGMDHFKEGANLKKLTNFCDLVDLAQFFKDKEISDKIILQGSDLGALNCISAYLNSPQLFKGLQLHNGIYDLSDYLIESGNISDKQLRLKKELVFGDYKTDKEIQEFILNYCPYQLMNNTYIKDYVFKNIMITCSSDFEHVDHSRKILAKFRENDENKEIYFKEFRDQSYESEMEMLSQTLGFIVNSALFGSAGRINN